MTRPCSQTGGVGHGVLEGLCHGPWRQLVRPWLRLQAGFCIMGSPMGRGDERWEPICTRKAEGPAQAFWQALLAGERGVVADLLSHPEHQLSPSAVFDTSDLEEWRNYRFNFRGLSTRAAAWRCWARAQSFASAAGHRIVCYGFCFGCGEVGMGVSTWDVAGCPCVWLGV